jgi:hypothetical protein
MPRYYDPNVTTMVFAHWEGVLLCVHGFEAPSPSAWSAYIDFCVGLPRTCNRQLVVTGAGLPNREQSRALEEKFKPTEVRVATLTDSAAIRHMIKATTMFNSRSAVFEYNHGEGVRMAAEHLGVLATDVVRLRREIEGMRSKLGLP